MVHASFCSGIDGPALAAARLGWEHAFYGDINEFCLTVLQYYYPNAKQYRDIRTADVREFRGKIDVYSAGFPCQPFSVAGDRSGEDHDSYLWPENHRIINDLRPTWFVGENVDGITSMVFPGDEVAVGGQTDIFGTRNTIYEKRERYIIDRICDDLEQIGYSVQPVIIPACSVGAPHLRYRCFFIAYNTLDYGETGDITNPSDTGVENVRESQDGIYAVGNAAYSQSERLQGAGRAWRGWDGFGNHDIQNAADPDGIGLRDQINRNGEPRFLDQTCAGDYWRNFPTQSPICGRNDGFPGRISGITVPRWTKEAIQALGNAIVPQAIFQIYQIVEMLHAQSKIDINERQ